MHPLAELGLDLVRSERAGDRLPHWDPRLWQAVDEGLQCKPKRDARRLNTLGIDWAKRSLQRSQHETAPQLASTRPSHGRPERSEDGRKGGGTARAGSARSARRQATTGGAAASQTAMPAEHASTRRAGRGWAARQAYGAKESDYRPDRWKGFREDYGFTGKEEDVEVGLTYFGRRFLSPYLGRWVSADPLGVHVPGEADLNLYAYVRGAALRSIDPVGLEESAPIGVNLTAEQKNAMGAKEGDYFFFDGNAEKGTKKFDNLESIKADAAKRGVPVFRVDGDASRTMENAKDFAEFTEALRSLRGDAAGADGPGGACTGPGCGTAVDGQKGAAGPTDIADAVAVAGGIASDETDLVEGGSDRGSPGGSCATCPGSKAQQLAIGVGRVAQLAAGAKGAQAAGNRWRLGLNDLDWRGTGKGVKEALDEAFERSGVSLIAPAGK